MTHWSAFFQVRDWLRKAEAETPERAWEFAREVHDIFVARTAKGGVDGK